MQRLEARPVRAAAGAAQGGRVGRVRLVLSRRDALAEFTTTKMAQRKFWRRPTLDRSAAMTRIATRPCSFRTSEMLRQSGVHPVLARLYASRGLTDARNCRANWRR